MQDIETLGSAAAATLACGATESSATANALRPSSIRTSVFDMYKIGPGPSSSHTIGPMKICNDFLKEVKNCFLPTLERTSKSNGTLNNPPGGPSPVGSNGHTHDQALEEIVILGETQNEVMEGEYQIAIHLFGSLSATGLGHGTHTAVIGGLLGWEPMTCDPVALPLLLTERGALYDFPVPELKIKMGAEHIVWHDPCDISELYHPNTLRLQILRGPDVCFEREYYSVGGGFIERKGGMPEDFREEEPVYPYTSFEQVVDHLKERTDSREPDSKEHDSKEHDSKEHDSHKSGSQDPDSQESGSKEPGTKKTGEYDRQCSVTSLDTEACSPCGGTPEFETGAKPSGWADAKPNALGELLTLLPTGGCPKSLGGTLMAESAEAESRVKASPSTEFLGGCLSEGQLGKFMNACGGASDVSGSWTRGIDVVELMLRNEEKLTGMGREEILEGVRKIIEVMDRSVERGLSCEGTLPGPIQLKRKAACVFERATRRSGRSVVCANDLGLLNAYAMAASEENAAGMLVVTAPTSGSSGVIPGLLYFMKKHMGVCESVRERSLVCGCLFGFLIKHNASISGAEMGCMGEIGVASAMGAAMLAYAQDCTLREVEAAAEIALEHHFGVTCDPIGGYVQIPCIQRNSMGAVKAYNAFILATGSDPDHQKINFDGAVQVMNQTGRDMHKDYKETSQGGLAKLNVVPC
ncbi:L-serine dehydratase [Gregarina niphandrodes]|uniref:L-serine dehydratase n=1 Tax=Gregarina niphandrodes TaxID=110365 RepID=A0A023B978_GRENI|nr:L-serine dehydratase [Gregarina niphandrodes]EZG71896.1 L-serine dehydratase [Gregarina niphandrodes]|eukprot:XP_011129806.1 L-serine dehydratase [Gregarina niphandrodes]